MFRKSLMIRLFDAFSIQRWNDQLRPVPMVEMDKNAHKMATAYCLAKCAEQEGIEIDWSNIIRGGIFELLRRSVLSDIKSPIYRKLRAEHPDMFGKLSQWVYGELESEFSHDEVLSKELKRYLVDDNLLDDVSRNILSASHLYASYWEFQIIREAIPDTDAVRKIQNTMIRDMAPYFSLTGLQKLLDRDPLAGFIDLVGQLRFQIRWGQTPRMPSTTVLGHSMMVACLSYFLTRALKVTACDRRVRNNFFGGLFHDLPETVTRDIPSPVKNAVPGLDKVLSNMEKELVQKEIYPLIDESWHNEFTYFVQDEFSSKIIQGGRVEKVTSDDICTKYNRDELSPIDGELVRAADQLAGFMEAKVSVDAGFTTAELVDGIHRYKSENTGKKVAGLNIGSIYADF